MDDSIQQCYELWQCIPKVSLFLFIFSRIEWNAKRESKNSRDELGSINNVVCFFREIPQLILTRIFSTIVHTIIIIECLVWPFLLHCVYTTMNFCCVCSSFLRVKKIYLVSCIIESPSQRLLSDHNIISINKTTKDYNTVNSLQLFKVSFLPILFILLLVFDKLEVCIINPNIRICKWRWIDSCFYMTLLL